MKHSSMNQCLPPFLCQVWKRADRTMSVLTPFRSMKRFFYLFLLPTNSLRLLYLILYFTISIYVFIFYMKKSKLLSVNANKGFQMSIDLEYMEDRLGSEPPNQLSWLSCILAEGEIGNHENQREANFGYLISERNLKNGRTCI